MILGSGDLGSCLGHGDGGFMNGIRAFTRETPQRRLALPSVRTQWEDTVFKPRRGLSPELNPAGALILNFPAFVTVRSTLLLRSHLVCGICYSSPNELRHWPFQKKLNVASVAEKLYLVWTLDPSFQRGGAFRKFMSVIIATGDRVTLCANHRAEKSTHKPLLHGLWNPTHSPPC